MERLTEAYGLRGTYSYAEEFLDFEIYESVWDNSVFLFIAALFFISQFILVILLLENCLTSCLVLAASFISVMAFFCAVYLLQIGINQISVAYAVICVGTVLSRSIVLSKTYLKQDNAKDIEILSMFSNPAKRKYLASKALAETASTVLHGMIVSVILSFLLSFTASTYTLQIFVRLWLVTTLASAFSTLILIPVILSICGPLSKKGTSGGAQASYTTSAVIALDNKAYTNS